MKPPEDTEVFELTLCTLWKDKEGILHSISKPVERTITNSTELMDFVSRLGRGEKVCMLSDISRSGGIDITARQYLNKELKHVYQALALITTTALGEMIGNIMLSLVNPGIPIKVFTNEVKAREWIMQYHAKAEPMERAMN